MNTKLAYFAGLFDGEGSIRIRKSNPWGKGISFKYDLGLAIRMTDPRPIKAFQKFFKARYCYDGNSRSSTCKPIHTVYANSNLAENIINQLRPFLIVKAEEADLAIRFQKYKRKTICRGTIGFSRRPTPKKFIDKRHQFHLQMSKLKKRILTIK